MRLLNLELRAALTGDLAVVGRLVVVGVAVVTFLAVRGREEAITDLRAGLVGALRGVLVVVEALVEVGALVAAGFFCGAASTFSPFNPASSRRKASIL